MKGSNRESQSIFFLVSIKCAARVRLGGWNSHIYYMLEIQGTITYLLLCNVKLHFRSPTVWEFSMRLVIVPTIKLLTELKPGWMRVVHIKCIYDAIRISFIECNQIYKHCVPLSQLFIQSLWLFRSQSKLNIAFDIKRLFKFKCLLHCGKNCE